MDIDRARIDALVKFFLNGAHHSLARAPAHLALIAGGAVGAGGAVELVLRGEARRLLGEGHADILKPVDAGGCVVDGQPQQIGVAAMAPNLPDVVVMGLRGVIDPLFLLLSGPGAAHRGAGEPERPAELVRLLENGNVGAAVRGEDRRRHSGGSGSNHQDFCVSHRPSPPE